MSRRKPAGVPFDEVKRIEDLLEEALNIKVPDGAWVKYSLRAAALAVIADRRDVLNQMLDSSTLVLGQYKAKHQKMQDRAEAAEKALKRAADYCSRPNGVCMQKYFLTPED